MTRKSWVVLTAVLLLLAAPGVLTAATAVDPAPPVVQAPPSVTGTARVGQLLTANPGTWTPTPTSYAYTWLRDGAVISGATAATYRLVGADRTHAVSVRVVATDDGGASLPATSAPTAAVGYGQFTNSTRPSISGVRRVGRTLKVLVGTWSPAPTSYKVQWMREDRPIAGATKATYTATVADFGKHLQVRVSPRRADYANGVTYTTRTAPIGYRVAVKKHFTYSIATRGHITADMTTFATLAAQTYADPRGWRAAGYEFTQVKHGGDFTLVLSNAAQMASFGYPCDSTWSCRVGRYVIINQTRWLHASPAWNAAHEPLRDYRHMVVNHETGHWLGHHHLTCPGKGKLAPIMMQQSKGLHGCRFNPFPLPSERWTTR